LRVLLAVVIGLGSGGLAGAAQPEPTAAAKQDEMMGDLDAVLGFCAKVDAKNQATYLRYRSELIGVGKGDDALMIPASKTPEYQQARHAMGEKLETLPVSDARAQCGRMVGAAP
jgi:hypothetical protein